MFEGIQAIWQIRGLPQILPGLIQAHFLCRFETELNLTFSSFSLAPSPVHSPEPYLLIFTDALCILTLLRYFNRGKKTLYNLSVCHSLCNPNELHLNSRFCFQSSLCPSRGFNIKRYLIILVGFTTSFSNGCLFVSPRQFLQTLLMRIY